MNFNHTEKTNQLLQKLQHFMDKNIYPLENEVNTFNTNPKNIWTVHPAIEKLKLKAQKADLWNLFLPKNYSKFSPGLSNLEYAAMAEIMGRIPWASEIFNCSAPDTGNMEVFAKYGSQAQQEKWLKPLMEGTIRSAFLMTEPQVASSDATNIQTSIVKDGNEYVINGRKWWSSGAMHPNCKVCIVMGKTDPNAQRHVQQSMIIIAMDTPGLKIIRPLSVMGNIDSPEGHAEILLENVRVPIENLLLGEGRGFEIAQGRLGPGRIHHCMRMIGMASRAMEMMCKRSTERSTFGKKLQEYSSIRQDVAKSKCEIEQARLLTLKAAFMMDTVGNKAATDIIAMIKIVAPNMLLKVVDRAMQIFGAKGVSQDLPLSQFYMYGRMLKYADGPDEVHMYQLGKRTIKEFS
ncbi:MAG: acyl-CoA dehydrogenase family protein [Flavobacteriaceae bacterium]|nr:acyl-CoA dehydrogenase family protein [Flavobacteriaceae bacterium]